MEHPGFYERAGPFTLAELIDAAEARPGPQAQPF